MDIITFDGIKYYKTKCACGCNKHIPCPTTASGHSNHIQRGIPEYLHGHNPHSGQFKKNHSYQQNDNPEELKTIQVEIEETQEQQSLEQFNSNQNEIDSNNMDHSNKCKCNNMIQKNGISKIIFKELTIEYS